MRDDTQKLLLTHSILIGVTPLIPIPLVDDLAKTYCQRRLVRKLVNAEGHELDHQMIKTLADDQGGCLSGCLTAALVYPAEKIFRKVFFFYEWGRAVSLIADWYHRGFLLEHVVAQGWMAPRGPRTPAEVRAAIDDVCRTAPVKPVRHAVRVALGESRSALKTAARAIERSWRRLARKPAGEDVEKVLEAVEQEEEQEISGVASRIQREIAGIPEEHFQGLRAALAARLGLGPHA